MVLDRLFLWIFLLAVLAGTAGIILQAPSLYDDRQPIDRIHSEIQKAVNRASAGDSKDHKSTPINAA
jgi:nicotinic acetylcholine receptor